VGADSVLVREGSSGPWLNLRDQPNVFRRARSLGFNASAIGWHVPYCRLWGDSLVGCYQLPGWSPEWVKNEERAAEMHIAKTVADLFQRRFRLLLDLFWPAARGRNEDLSDIREQQQQQEAYFRIRNRAYGEAIDKETDFLYVHFPIPHPFAIYDRQRDEFALNDKISYFDNLALADRTIGEMRRALEANGLWDSTTVLITSDHGLRPWVWRSAYDWNPDVDIVTVKNFSQTVPFILKLAGHHQPVMYDQPFSNVISGDLCLAVLRGDVSGPEQALAWLAKHQ